MKLEKLYAKLVAEAQEGGAPEPKWTYIPAEDKQKEILQRVVGDPKAHGGVKIVERGENAWELWVAGKLYASGDFEKVLRASVSLVTGK